MCRVKLELDKAKGRRRMIIKEEFYSRTLAKMNGALDSVCETVQRRIACRTQARCKADDQMRKQRQNDARRTDRAAGQRPLMAKPRTS
jgi:hypothetical protein